MSRHYIALVFKILLPVAISLVTRTSIASNIEPAANNYKYTNTYI